MWWVLGTNMFLVVTHEYILRAGTLVYLSVSTGRGSVTVFEIRHLVTT